MILEFVRGSKKFKIETAQQVMFSTYVIERISYILIVNTVK